MSTEFDTIAPPGRPPRRQKANPGLATSVCLEEELDQLLTEYIKNSVPRVTKSAVIRAAIRQFLETNGR